MQPRQVCLEKLLVWPILSQWDLASAKCLLTAIKLRMHTCFPWLVINSFHREKYLVIYNDNFSNLVHKSFFGHRATITRVTCLPSSSLLTTCACYNLTYLPPFEGLIGIQQHVWQATLNDDALLWGTHPGPRDGDHSSTYWTGGGSLPRVDQRGSVLIALYNPTIQGHADRVFSNFTHAFFPTERFDDVQDQNGAYLSIAIRAPPRVLRFQSDTSPIVRVDFCSEGGWLCWGMVSLPISIRRSSKRVVW